MKKKGHLVYVKMFLDQSGPEKQRGGIYLDPR